MTFAQQVGRQIAGWAGPATVAAMLMSALLNAFTFAEHVAGLAKAISALLGVMMPVAIYTLTKLAVPLYVNGDR